MSVINDFLTKHPTPWKLVDSKCVDTGNDDHEAIVDANGNEVIRSADPDEYQSWFVGDIESLIAFVNAVGVFRGGSHEY